MTQANENQNVLATAHETSLSALSDHDWQVLSNRWARGIEWMVQKVGTRHWIISEVVPQFKAFGLFKTKREAFEAVTNLILAESHWRAAQRLRGTTP